MPVVNSISFRLSMAEKCSCITCQVLIFCTVLKRLTESSKNQVKLV